MAASGFHISMVIDMDMNDELMSMAEDIKTFCNYCHCYDVDFDEFGYEEFTNVCPFLEKGVSPEDAICVIGDPTSWDI